MICSIGQRFLRFFCETSTGEKTTITSLAGATTFSITTLCIMPFGIKDFMMTLNVTTVSITDFLTLSINENQHMTLSIAIIRTKMLSINDIQHNDNQNYDTQDNTFSVMIIRTMILSIRIIRTIILSIIYLIETLSIINLIETLSLKTHSIIKLRMIILSIIDLKTTLSKMTSRMTILSIIGLIATHSGNMLIVAFLLIC
jgi:hypothetical protein